MNQDNIKNYKEIVWDCPRSYFWACLIFAILVASMAIGFFYESKGFFTYLLVFLFILIVFMLRMPKRIRIDEDTLIISWITGTKKIKKENIKSIIKKKCKYATGQWYYFRILLNKPFSIKIIYETAPMIVTYEIEPYYNLEPSKIYDIVEEIAKWFTKGNSVSSH